MKAVSVQDYRALAQRRLPKFLFEYIDGGAYEEVTLRANREDLQKVSLRQRVLHNVSSIRLARKLLGQDMDLPVALAPIGLAGMSAHRGEVQAARAAQAAGVPFTLSTVSLCDIEEVSRGLGAPFWFQLYMIRDRGLMKDLLARAHAAGCSALIFTVDMPVPGSRYRDYRSGLAGAPGLAGDLRRFWQALARPGWAFDVGVRGRPHHLGNVAPVLGGDTGLEDFFRWMRENFDPTVTWKDLELIRREWPGPLLIKGVLDAEDAVSAASLGADGVVVSNHGGRQLDGVPSTARALPAIAEALDGRIALLADGGVRSGLDVVRLMALGADAVLLGRAWAYALAGGGQAGVAHMLGLIEAEMRVAMALCGVTDVDEIDASILCSLPQ